MHNKFEDILAKQEKEDKFIAMTEASLLHKLKSEYLNYGEILNFLHSELKKTSSDGLMLPDAVAKKQFRKNFFYSFSRV